MKVLSGDEASDPCTTNIQFEHAAGCVVESFTPLLRFAGVITFLYGFYVAKKTNKAHNSFDKQAKLMGRVLKFFNFIVLMSIWYSYGWFEGIDPTSNSELSVESSILPIGIIISVFMTGIVLAKVFEKYIHFGPIFLGAILSYFITMFLLLAA
jgi:hypothetical protein